MTAIAAQNLEKNAVPRGKSTGYNDRRATDKYWGLLFIVVLIIWIAVARHVFDEFYHGHKSAEKLDSFDTSTHTSVADITSTHHVNSKKENLSNSFKAAYEYPYGKFRPDRHGHVFGCLFFGRESYYGRFKRDVKETIKHADQIWDQNWILDTIACNVGFFNEYYQRSGSIVIWANVLFCVCLIAYSLASLSANHIYRIILPIFGLYFVYTFICRSVYFLLNVAFNLQAFQDLDFSITYWLVPESILFCLVVFYRPLPQCYDRDNGKDEVNKTLRFEIRLIGYTFIIALPSVLFIVTLFVFAFVMCQSNVDKNLLYIFVGIICYVLLITYYFVLMVISCANGLSLDHDRRYPRIQDFLRAWIIVARYHFGTACYHATIIVPKIKAVLIMNEEEFKVIPNFSAIERLYMMHWKVHDLSLVLTAVRGHDFSKSARELLRLSTRESPKPIKNCFTSFSQLFRCCSILLIAMNSLLIIALWACGVTLEQSAVVHTWIIYVLGMFGACILGRLVDVCVDTYWFHSDGKLDMEMS